jgi:hypothetical protein
VAEQVDFYTKVGHLHPGQQFFTVKAVDDFLLDVYLDLIAARPIKVLEIGGWRGELAAAVFVHNQIGEWLNVEVLKDAELPGHNRGPWYRAWVPSDYIWRVGVPTGYDALVMSHTIEHMRAEELRQILAQFDGPWVYLEAPLHEGGWDGYGGTHILEIGWPQVDEMLAELGYRKIHSSGEAVHPDAEIAVYRRGTDRSL